MRVMMKMAAVSAVTALLLCCSAFAATDPQNGCNIFAATGENVIVPLNHELKNSQRLQWKRGDSIIFDRRDGRVITGREDDIDDKGSLKLTKVKEDNKGTYSAQVFDGGKSQHTQTTKLCTMDAVPQPTVTVVCTPSASPSTVKFTCNVKPPKEVTFKWFHNNILMEKEGSQTLTFKDSDKRWKQLETDTFSCNISNRVSVKSSVPLKQTCIKTKSLLPEKLWGINTWIIIGVGGGVVVLLIIIVIICCCRNRRRRRMRLKDEEELRLGWSNPNQQQQQRHQHHQNCHPQDQHQHQHQHHHHQQQPAGHTGPRQHRTKQQRGQQQRPRAPDVPNGHPQPSPRRPAQAPRPVDNTDDEQPPPLPQPRKKAPKTPRE